MHLRKRFTILGIILAFFFIAATVAITFAMGYRFDFSTKKFIATGSLVISSVPKNARIVLNGVDSGRKTPATIRLLNPGEYDVVLKKDGYNDWSKRLTILPQQVTWSVPLNGNIALFLKNSVALLSESKAFDLLFVQNEPWAATASSTVMLKNLLTANIFTTAISSQTPRPPKFTITSDAAWIIETADSGIRFVQNLSNNSTMNMQKFNLKFVDAVSYGKSLLLLRTDNGQIYQFDAEGKILNLRRGSSSAFAASGDDLYFLDDNLVYQSNTSSSTTQLIAAAPAAHEAKFIIGSRGDVYLILDKNIFQVGKQLRRLGENVVDGYWDSRSRSLLFYNPNEVWVYSPQSDAIPQLVVRSSAPITHPQINFESGQIYFIEGQKIKAIETYGLVNRVISELATSDKPIEKFYVDEEAKYIYYYVPDEGVYSMQIR